MIETENRNYKILASVEIKKYANSNYNKPVEDIVKWWHLELKKTRHTIIYQIVSPETAEYNEPFLVKISFLNDEIAEDLNKTNEYNLFRGPEMIGKLKVIDFI